MRAMVMPEQGGQFEEVERPVPEPGPDEVLLAVEACGVCHSDSIVVDGLMPGLQWPIVPGHEVVGRIAALGEGVTGFNEGQRVGVGWHPGDCGVCEACRRGDRFACENIGDITGIARDGGYATHMVARASAVARVPDELDAVDAAPLMCAGVTTFASLRDAGAEPGDLVCVFGVGGLGHLAIQYAARMGFEVVAANRGTEKRDLALELGADHYIDTTDGDPAEQLQELGGAKVLLATAVDGDAMAEIAPGNGRNGVFLLIGAVPELTVDPMDLITKRGMVKGWYSGVAADSEDTLAFSASQDVDCRTEVFDLVDAQKAYDHMMDGAARFRAVLRVE